MAEEATRWTFHNLLPLAEGLHVVRRPVSEPSIHLRRFLQLLATLPWDNDVRASEFRECRHVSPQFFILKRWIHIFLPFSPTLFHVFERDVCRHSRCK